MRRSWLILLLLGSLMPMPGAADQPIRFRRPVRGLIIRHFEPPPTPYSAGHRGIDLAAPEGADVAASEAGVVSFAGQVGGRLYVSVDHAGGLRTTYSFLSEVLVSEGEAVVRGQIVARTGTGHAGAEQPHLHFGLRRDEEYLDPEPELLTALRADLTQAIRLVA